MGVPPIKLSVLIDPRFAEVVAEIRKLALYTSPRRDYYLATMPPRIPLPEASTLKRTVSVKRSDVRDDRPPPTPMPLGGIKVTR